MRNGLDTGLVDHLIIGNSMFTAPVTNGLMSHLSLVPVFSGLTLYVCTQGNSVPFSGQKRVYCFGSRDGLEVALMRNILVTGATGFLGVHLLSALLESGDAHLTLLSRAEPK